MSGLAVGIDFDNTIATYDRLFHQLALERGLIDGQVPHSKRHVRDAVRMREEGESHWQRLQASAYGIHMPYATIAPGAAGFLARCRDGGTPVYVISHRSRFAAVDPEGVPLRDAAIEWMRAQGVIGAGCLGVGQVFFESTRADKIARIASLGCSHFIDDLPEVLLDPAFPAAVVKVLYAPDRQRSGIASGMSMVSNWDEAHEVVFGRR